MNDDALIQKLDDVIRQSRKREWDQPIPAATPMRLMVQLDRLRRRDPQLWNQAPQEIIARHADDHDLLGVLRETDPLALAFAIRLQRMAGASFSTCED